MKKPNRKREVSQQHKEALQAATAEPSKRLNIQVSQSLHTEIKTYAAGRGITIQELVIGAVKEIMRQ